MQSVLYISLLLMYPFTMFNRIRPFSLSILKVENEEEAAPSQNVETKSGKSFSPCLSLFLLVFLFFSPPLSFALCSTLNFCCYD